VKVVTTLANTGFSGDTGVTGDTGYGEDTGEHKAPGERLWLLNYRTHGGVTKAH
jgi:hypothetical protein